MNMELIRPSKPSQSWAKVGDKILHIEVGQIPLLQALAEPLRLVAMHNLFSSAP